AGMRVLPRMNKQGCVFYQVMNKLGCVFYLSRHEQAGGEGELSVKVSAISPYYKRALAKGL
ncbi:MAG: hypothetical protein ACPGWR_29210, partial [Ardenticatenaceae bacterium]